MGYVCLLAHLAVTKCHKLVIFSCLWVFSLTVTSWTEFKVHGIPLWSQPITSMATLFQISSPQEILGLELQLALEGV